jgi:hypothetical protein
MRVASARSDDRVMVRCSAMVVDWRLFAMTASWASVDWLLGLQPLRWTQRPNCSGSKKVATVVLAHGLINHDGCTCLRLDSGTCFARALPWNCRCVRRLCFGSRRSCYERPC